MRLCFFALVSGLILLAPASQASANPIYVRFNTNLGNIDVELFQDTAPLNVANFMSYVNGGSYNNLIINRNVPGFVFQAGEITLISNSSGNSIGTNTPGASVNSEETLPGAHSNTRGTIAFALQADQTTGVTEPDSGTNQWFFNEVDNGSPAQQNLDAQGFTAFGMVMNSSSLSVMDLIASVPPTDQSVFFNTLFNLATNDPFGVDYFGELPLINYTSPAAPQVPNLIIVNSITTLPAPQNFTAWQTTEFGSSPQLDDSPAGTPFNDGVPNLLKYVCDINPIIPMTAAVRASLPTIGQTTISGTSYVTLTYHQHNELTGVTVNVQSSPDLQTWTTLPNPNIVQTGTDTNGDPIMQVQVAATAASQFLRLNITMP